MLTPSEIHKTLMEIHNTFPKSSKMFVGFIEDHSKTGMFEGTTQEASVLAMKNAWQLENKAPTRTFATTDEAVIDYARSIGESSAQSPCKMLIVIDMNKALTSVWVVPKGMCFIATAAYGSPLATEVLVLSRFRDEVLLQSMLGRSMVGLYYTVSPPIASYIEGNKPLKTIIRIMLVPILYLVRTQMHRQ